MLLNINLIKAKRNKRRFRDSHSSPYSFLLAQLPVLKNTHVPKLFSCFNVCNTTEDELDVCAQLEH